MVLSEEHLKSILSKRMFKKFIAENKNNAINFDGMNYYSIQDILPFFEENKLSKKVLNLEYGE